MEIFFGLVSVDEPNKVLASYRMHMDAIRDWKEEQFIRLYDRNNTRFLDKRIETVSQGRTFVSYGTDIFGEEVKF
jgi:hypothetical protein